MIVEHLSLAGVLKIEPKVFGDARGYFLETWSEQRYAERCEIPSFVQDNLSRSTKGVIRGLHLQHPNGQGKLVAALLGSIYDVAVDVRVGSPTFGRWLAEELSEQNHCQLYIPPGFAHGFAVLSESAIVSYKTTAAYSPPDELGIRYDDPELGIPWPVSEPLVSEKDTKFPLLSELLPRLPRVGDA